jgi:hypothetical protein
MKGRIGKAAAVAMVAGTLSLGSLSLAQAGAGGQGNAYHVSSLSRQTLRSQEPREPKKSDRMSIAVLSLLRTLIGIL